METRNIIRSLVMLDPDENSFKIDIPENESQIYHYVNVANATPFILYFYERKDFDVENDTPWAIIAPVSFVTWKLPYNCYLEFGIRAEIVKNSNEDYIPPINGKQLILHFTTDSLGWTQNVGLDVLAKFNSVHEAMLQMPDGYPTSAELINLINLGNMQNRQLQTMAKLSAAGNYFALSTQMVDGSFVDGQSLYDILLGAANLGNTGNMLIPSYITSAKFERMNPSFTDGQCSIHFKNPFGQDYGQVPFPISSIYTVQDKMYLSNKEILAYYIRYFYIDPQTGTKVYTDYEIMYPTPIVPLISFSLEEENSDVTFRINGNVYFEEISGVEIEVEPPAV